MEKVMHFEFGKNWQSYSKKSLTPARMEQSRCAFRDLVTGIDMRDKKFIDIGFGQGLSLLAAAGMGAQVLGIDADKDNIEALRTVQQSIGYPEAVEVCIASILDDHFVDEYRGRYDIVHSWGVLHHTGNMMKAIENACSLVAERGHFICAIYNRHWSSPLWKIIKWSYNRLPSLFQRTMIAIFYPVIYAAKLLVTREDPKKTDRGMDFLHDVVDWVGGYPYDYAGIEEIRNYVCRQGFICLRIRPAQVPTGCNEFVFQKTKNRDGSCEKPC
jgi:2-polyprenyl-3-methyl-5-hydroxy-6-metoxy-1,4-benzoquinol methylase